MPKPNTFSVTIALDSAAFEDTPDVEASRILRLIADSLSVWDFDNPSMRVVRDHNGNTVGNFVTHVVE